ncbi:DUF757-domain-containing protein [Dacryopinax primogenitus]|uniref:DUF757-domain-containing protein n=1 Tax=Dacryopinax primogenitus (strain DJM 731) TaxID=1858805 RepID=M5G6P4_DACPD|nr:DUF757-domain-containing protein [Dacryopinax primogenitus]EJU01492.1 DUF757-domain-containing protein [Dacryopinax primogenitus]
MAQPFDPETAENLIEIDKQFAVRTVEHAQTHWNLITRIPPRKLKLTPIDDEIYEDFKKGFPELADFPDKLSKLDDEDLKSPEAKKRWREWMAKYEKKLKDYNFGTLLRNNAKEEYGEHNAMLVLKIQWCAIEIARNRLGLNDYVYDETQRQMQAAAAKKT